MNNIASPAVCGQAKCGQSICGSSNAAIREIRVTKLPIKKISISGEPFDTTGLEITAFYTDGTSAPITGWRVEPMRALTLADRYVNITYGKSSTKLPVKVAVKTSMTAHMLQRFYNNGVWSGWTHMDFVPPFVSYEDGVQARAVVSVGKSMDLGGRSAAGIELWLKKSSASADVKGHIKVNNVEVPLTDEYAHAYIGKVKKGDTGLFDVNIDYVDVNVNFESDAYVVLCRDNDPATHNASKQIALAAEATASMDLCGGKADYIFTDFASDDTLLGIDISHIYGQIDENFRCGKQFGINLYERLETSAFPLSDKINMPCYTDAFGYKHGFNMVFYTKRIDYDKVNGSDFDMEDPNIWVKDYIKNISDIVYDEASGRYILNEWFVECEQTTVNNQMYLSEPTSAVSAIKSSLTFDKETEPVCWLRGDNITKGFNADGRLVMISDEFGNYVRVFYNDDGLITSVKNKKGNSLEFAYQNSLLSHISYGTGRKKVKYSYTSGMLSEINYCADDSHGFEYVYKTIKLEYAQIYRNGELYDAIKKIENSNKLASVMEYEDGAFADTRLTGVRNYSTTDEIPQGKTANTNLDGITIEYDDENRTVAIIDDSGDKELYKFTQEETLCEYYEIAGDLVVKAEKNDYTAYGENISVSASDAVLHKYSFGEFVFEEGVKTVSELTPYNKPSREIVGKIKTGDGTYKTVQTDYGYDLRNRCIKQAQTEKYFNSSDICVDTNYYSVHCFYDLHDAVAKVVTHTAHDENGTRVEEFADAVEYVYDEYGNVASAKSYRISADHSVSDTCVCDSSATSDIFYTEKSFDAYRRVINEKDVTGIYSTSYAYRTGTNLISKITSPDGGIIRKAYNAQGDMTQIDTTVNGDENKNTVQYTDGEVTAYNHSGNNAIEYIYDSKRRLKNIKLNGCAYETYKYDDDIFENGKRIDKVTITNAKNERFTAVADRGGSFNKMYYNDSPVFQGDFNAKGELTKSEDKLSGEIVTYAYNSVGSLKEYVRTLSERTYKENATYDVKGRAKEVTYSGTVTRTDKFDYAVSAMDKIERMSTGSFEILPKHDVHERYTGKEVRIKGVNAESESITYIKEGDHLTHLPKTISYKSGSLSYEYDKNGNISRITKNGRLVARYEYDTLNRLIREDNWGTGVSLFYSYDNNGNITSKEECDFTTESHTLGTGTVISYLYDDYGKLSSYNGQDCEYDALNNPTLYRGKSATWTRGRKLSAFNGNTFAYDAQGHRIKKNNITYTYDSGGRLLKQSNGLEFYYDMTGLVGMKYNGINYVYRKDVQGNITAILDGNGAVVVEYIYDAWGNHTLAGSGTIIGEVNPFRYRSYYYDTETYLYYLNTRYYDPEVGRFINMDSISYADPETINGLNLYAYCGNNPVMRYDPNGCAWWHWLIGAAVVVGLVVATVISAGSIAGGVLALGAAINGVASATMATTVLSFAAVGAGMIYAASAVVAGIYSLEAWSNSGSFYEGVDTFMNQGESAMWSTIGAGITGGIGGFLSYKEQIGDSSQAGFMTKNQRAAQRRALKKQLGDSVLKGKQISHIYGTYGNNRNYYILQTPAEHRAFHQIYGYKTAGGHFNRTNPNFHNWWEMLKTFLGI